MVVGDSGDASGETEISITFKFSFFAHGSEGEGRGGGEGGGGSSSIRGGSVVGVVEVGAIGGGRGL